jgi:hypothetical protein
MSRNNYSYEKRHRELEKKKKKEAKRLKKLQQKEDGVTEEIKYDKFGLPIVPEDDAQDKEDSSHTDSE